MSQKVVGVRGQLKHCIFKLSSTTRTDTNINYKISVNANAVIHWQFMTPTPIYYDIKITNFVKFYMLGHMVNQTSVRFQGYII